MQKAYFGYGGSRKVGVFWPWLQFCFEVGGGVFCGVKARLIERLCGHKRFDVVAVKATAVAHQSVEPDVTIQLVHLQQTTSPSRSGTRAVISVLGDASLPSNRRETIEALCCWRMTTKSH